MTYVLADNIFSPLGSMTEENLQAVLEGRSVLRRHVDKRGLLSPYTASLFEERMSFEDMIVCSARRALMSVELDFERTVLILSTTKGTIGTSLGESAQRIAAQLGIKNVPITVCNACISGLSAIILGKQLLEAGFYENAVVCGADVQGEFIVSGFQSLKALSPNECRPFDMERTGLNLGEAAATIILSRHSLAGEAWQIERGSVHNDAYHISTPSKTAEGLYRCLQDVLGIKDERELSSPSEASIIDESSEPLTLNLHGTATMFNDQMESVAIKRAGLSSVPANGLKGYYGHTMGAAGILETVLTMHALNHHIIIGTRGFDELGVSGKINLSSAHRPTVNSRFVKCLAGFGGGNAAILVSKSKEEKFKENKKKGEKRVWQQLRHVRMTPEEALFDGQKVSAEKPGLAGLTALYKSLGIDYPKYYKMDALSRLGFLAAEILLKNVDSDENTAIVLFNRTSSIVSDKKHLATISDERDYFPSPSVFVYTLPNIVLGEIALRHGLHGETSLFVLPERNEEIMQQIIQTTPANRLITGWLDYEDDLHYEADICLLELKQ